MTDVSKGKVKNQFVGSASMPTVKTQQERAQEAKKRSASDKDKN